MTSKALAIPLVVCALAIAPSASAKKLKVKLGEKSDGTTFEVDAPAKTDLQTRLVAALIKTGKNCALKDSDVQAIVADLGRFFDDTNPNSVYILPPWSLKKGGGSGECPLVDACGGPAAPQVPAAPTEVAGCQQGPQESLTAAAYFQSSQNVFGYWGSTDLENTYDAAKVVPYAKSFAEHVRSKGTGLCLDMKVFHGVEEKPVTRIYSTPTKALTNENLCGANLHYLDKAGCTVDDPFLIKKVSNGKGEPGNNGLSKWAGFRCAFDKTLLKAGTLPLFAIVDHNSFHNLSAPLVRHAFANHRHGGGTAIKLLVHFDGHPDYTSRPTETIGCDNWIARVARSDQGTDQIVARHVWFGNFDKSGSALPIEHAQGAGLTKASGRSLTEVLGDLAPGGSVVDLYITVDRDFMTNSHTPWGDGVHSAAEGRQRVKDAIAFLASRPGSHLVGFDVTGLPAPAQANPPKSARAERKKRQFYLDQAKEDVAELHAAFVARVGAEHGSSPSSPTASPSQSRRNSVSSGSSDSLRKSGGGRK